MGFKRLLGKAGRFAGKAALAEVGLTTHGGNFKMTEELQQQIAEAVYHGTLQALKDYEPPRTEPRILPMRAQEE